MSQMATADRLDYQRGVQTEPLTERDVQLVHRLLSDPTVFPREFRNWVTSHSSDTVDIAKTQVHGLINSTGQVVIGGASLEMLGATLPGFIFGYPSAAIPNGWLLCDGRELLRVDYEALFSLIGTSWGTPSTSDKFLLPDFRDRSPYGAGSVVGLAGTDGLVIGTRGGPNHHHDFSQSTNSQGAHSHGGQTGGGGSHSHGVSGSTGGVGDHQHLARDDGTPSVQQGATPTGASGTARNTTQNERYYTGNAGAHSHSVSGSTDSASSHQHSIGSDGAHAHSVSGPTSGGYSTRPSFAGVHFIMGSGVVPP